MIEKDIQQREREIRDEEAQHWLDWFFKYRGKWFDYVQKRALFDSLAVTQTDVVLDAGCGVGRIAVDIAPLVRSVYAIDFSEKSIEVLQKAVRDNHFYNVNSRVADITRSLDFPDNYFDKVLCVEVLQHIPSTEKRIKVLQEFYRVLKSGGRCSVMDYNWRGRGERVSTYGKGIYRYCFETTEIRQLFMDAGFNILNICGVVNFPKLLHLNKLMASLDILVSRTSISKRIGMFLLVSGMKL